MSDLTSAAFATKIAGLSAGAILAAIVVMAITPARNAREFIVGMVSTLVASLSGGAAAASYLGLTEQVHNPWGLAMLGGLFFVCGLPGWLLVRAFFLWAERNKGKDLAQLLGMIRKGWPRDE